MLRARLRELAGMRRRFGYRRLHLLLKNEGLVMNHKKLRRLYRKEGLQVAAVAVASVRWALGRRWRYHKAPISAGAWTSCRMPWPMAGASVF
jgi:hypothetical protein